MDAAAVGADFARHLGITLGRDDYSTDDSYRYQALALTLRDRIMERWKATHHAYYEQDCRRAYYLSMEFLMGRALGNAAINLGVEDAAIAALKDWGLTLEDLAEAEADAGLGNGGLGRLAACFMDSCATLQLPVMGYGLRYEYGMFRQRIVDGNQVEEPDHWLRSGSAWEIERLEYAQTVRFRGRSEFYRDPQGRSRVRWVDTEDVVAVPYDVPVPGWRNGTVNTLRLWRSHAPSGFDLGEFNAGDYEVAVKSENDAASISMVLYPNDKSQNGKELRLRQQFFLASASLQDVLRRWVRVHGEDFSTFADKNIFQLNDTHPTVAVAELMRLLMDEHGLGWETAWGITTRCMAYTNHTLLPEALEKWPVALFRSLLPRVLDIIFEINARFMRQVANRWPGDGARQARLSIIDDNGEPQVRMAYLAIVGSCSVNGVAQLHTDLLVAGLFREFHELWPEKFNNKTNGVTQRRWLAMCNHGQAALMTEVVGDGWQTDLGRLEGLKKVAGDAAFQKRWAAVKRANKERLAELVAHECGVRFDPDAMFDVQVKRIHEYKRQLLNILHVVHLYDRIKRGDTANWTDRCVLFGGKAAPGYAMAKRIIKLAGNVAEVVNADAAVGKRLKCAFIPNYRVSLMEVIAPGTDLSEQISTAGKEASGTGNMKFMMNGALTIGTLDGANIEIRDACGPEHFFLFGLTAEEVESRRAGYRPQELIAADENLRRVLHLLGSGHFSQVEPGIFDDILASLTTWGDHWMIVADFADYVRAQNDAATAYRDARRWWNSSIINAATSGRFSTDRTMGDYNRDIWKLQSITPSVR
jgi:starch phosphorylase